MPTVASSREISANGDITSDDYTTKATGTIYWVSSFCGDGNHSKLHSFPTRRSSDLTVGPASPGIVTKAQTPVTVGGTAHDTATLSGLVSADGTGTVTIGRAHD